MANSALKTGVFRKDIEIIRQKPMLLFDRHADAYYRISEKTARIVSYMTESLTVAEFQEKLARLGITVTGEEIVNLISFLYSNNLLEAEYGRMSLHRERLKYARKKSRWMRWASSYMFFRLPPWHPEKFFGLISPYVSFLASKWMVICLMIPAILGYLLALRDFSAVQTMFMDSLSWAGLVKYFVAIVLLKIIHEAAHSLAAIRFRCRVRGIGIGFMVFYPRLYTDTTDSWQLPRNQRLLIDAAGIIVELLCGGIAALLYFYLPPGELQSTMFYIFAVSTLATLLVNGNPCIRYDGYYILCDLTGIDNLMTRSGEYVKGFWRYYLLKLGTKPHHKHGLFLFIFGVTSFIYRLFLYTAIILVIYHKFIKVLAVILLILELYMLFILPCWRELKTIHELSRKSSGRAGVLLLAAVSAGIAILLFMPLNWSIELPGEVVPVFREVVPVAEGGFLREAVSPQPRQVKKGELLMQLEAPRFGFLREKLLRTKEADELKLKMELSDDKEFVNAGISREKIASDEKGLAELDRREKNLSVTAPADGIWVVPNADEFGQNRFLTKGISAGEVISDKCVVYAYADDREAGKLRPGMEAKLFAGDTVSGYPAKITGVEKIALPVENSPLLQVFGGEIPMYQSEKESGKFYSTRLYYRVTLTFDRDVPLGVGRRVRCEIDNRGRLYDILLNEVVGIFRREF